MKHVLTTAAAIALFATLGACKQGDAGESAGTAEGSTVAGIAGTWLIDIASAKFDSKPDEVTLEGGQYECKSCTPPYKVAADGKFHPVDGLAYADEISVKADSDSKVTETAKKGGREVGLTTYTVSPDGKTLTVEYTDSSVEGGKPISGKLTETRVGEAPAGAHAVSGQWKMDKVADYSPEGLTVTYRLDGDTLHMTSPDGTSFDAKTDGTEAPVKGDIGGTVVSVTKTGSNVWQIVSKRKGKATNTTTLTFDGDTMHASSKNEQDGTTMTYDAKRQ
jgi:hypothetical protein